MAENNTSNTNNKPTLQYTFLPKSEVNKLKIIRRVAVKINEIQKNKKYKPSPHLPFIFTGLQPKVLDRLANVEEINVGVLEVDRSVIYDTLLEFYTVEKIMPSTFHLFKALENELPSYMDITEFRKLLVKFGFQWKHIANIHCVVIERPEIVFERHRYLKKLIQYREEKKPIYIIDENCFNVQGYFMSSKRYFKDVKSTEVSMWKKVIYTVSSAGVEHLTFIDDFNQENFNKFVKEKFMKSLCEPSVIILDSSKHHCEEIVKLPNKFSHRNEMIAWLDYFNVPYDQQCPKAVLFDLIEKFTDTTNRIYTIDSILKSRGHFVLRVPDCIQKMSPAGCISEVIHNNLNIIFCSTDHNKQYPLRDVEDKFLEIIESINEHLPSQIIHFCSIQEFSMYNKDCAIDDILDELEMSMLKKGLDEYYIDSDIPSCSDSE